MRTINSLLRITFIAFSYLIIAYLFSANSFSQITTEETFGGINSERGTMLEVTSDGGYIITGSTSSFTSDQVCISLS